jgi:hypothetical protein
VNLLVFKEYIAEIAKDRGIEEFKAFAFFFLEDVEDLSEEEAEQSIIDGPWDGKIDAFYQDTVTARLILYQFKYTDNPNYAVGGIGDLVKAVRDNLDSVNKIFRIKEKEIDLNEIKTLKACLVTSAKLEEIHGQKRKDYISEKRRNLQRFFNEQGLPIEADFDIIDYYKIDELYTGSKGIPIAEFDINKGNLLRFPLDEELELVVTFLKGEELAKLCSEYGDELFESNVRRFLGLRRGSINREMLDTLETQERKFFHLYNNGIVAVCGDFTIDNEKLRAERFAIVNGAQTVNILKKAYEKNFTLSDVFVLAKIVNTKNSEIAFKVAKTANSQNPTNVRDLRSLDKVHELLKTIFDRYGLIYIYKRGIGVRRRNTIKMKELAQSYVAFYLGKPHVSYARVQSIFEEGPYYNEIFNYDKVNEALEKGPEHVEKLAIKYFLPYHLLNLIKAQLKDKEKRPIDPAFTYHILWVLGAVYERKILEKPQKMDSIQDYAQKIIFAPYFHKVCEEFNACTEYNKKITIPRSLKAEQDLVEFEKVLDRILRGQ